MRLTILLAFAVTLHAENVPTTVEQLQTKVAEQAKEIEQLRAYIAAIEQFDQRNIAVMQAAVSACIGPRPQSPAKEKP